jgi:SHAQKYF class myb-like DNA-binding protein
MSGGRWSDLEHQRFLQGLEACGRGEWRAISESFVPTRSPEQVRIHAQKYLQKQEKTRGKAQGKKPGTFGVFLGWPRVGAGTPSRLSGRRRI